MSAAKTAATAKGAPAVGALASSEFSSLPSGSYVIYSGDYSTGARGQKTLSPACAHKFPAAKVDPRLGWRLRLGSAGGAVLERRLVGRAPRGDSSLNHPAPLRPCSKASTGKGKNYEEASKNLPNVVETG